MTTPGPKDDQKPFKYEWTTQLIFFGMGLSVFLALTTDLQELLPK